MIHKMIFAETTENEKKKKTLKSKFSQLQKKKKEIYLNFGKIITYLKKEIKYIPYTDDVIYFIVVLHTIKNPFLKKFGTSNQICSFC